MRVTLLLRTVQKSLKAQNSHDVYFHDEMYLWLYKLTVTVSRYVCVCIHVHTQKPKDKVQFILHCGAGEEWPTSSHLIEYTSNPPIQTGKIYHTLTRYITSLQVLMFLSL